MISKVKGGFQVREMVESSAMAFRSPTAESRPYTIDALAIVLLHNANDYYCTECKELLYIDCTTNLVLVV